MSRISQFPFTCPIRFLRASKSALTRAALITLLLVVPVAALAQGSPFDTGFNAIQSLFTGTIAKVASLVAIVIGGYGFAHGEPGAKKALAGVAAGTGIAVLAALGGGTVALQRRFAPRPGAGALQVISRVGLSPKHTVYLLRAGGRVLLVGTGPQGAPSLISELDEVPLVEPATGQGDAA